MSPDVIISHHLSIHLLIHYYWHSRYTLSFTCFQQLMIGVQVFKPKDLEPKSFITSTKPLNTTSVITYWYLWHKNIYNLSCLSFTHSRHNHYCSTSFSQSFYMRYAFHTAQKFMHWMSFRLQTIQYLFCNSKLDDFVLDMLVFLEDMIEWWGYGMSLRNCKILMWNFVSLRTFLLSIKS